jgi:hypothetical protein
MTEIPVVTDSFFLGPDIAFDGEAERGFEVWQLDGHSRFFVWAEVNRDGDIINTIIGPFPSARGAHHDALLALSAREERDASKL